MYLLVGSFIQKNLYVSESEEERRENRDQLYSVDLKQRIEHTVFLVNFLKGREELSASNHDCKNFVRFSNLFSFSCSLFVSSCYPKPSGI